MSAAAGKEPHPARRDTVSPLLPLALLESVREHDRPGEVLEEEDLAISLPRRLGLTDVVENQIHRYRHADKRSESVPAGQVGELLRLLLRRPDAEAIVFVAGRRVAWRLFHRRSPVMLVRLGRLLPLSWLIGPLFRNAATRMLRESLGAGEPQLRGVPPVTRIRASIMTEADHSGTACAFYTGVLRQLLELYCGDETAVEHTRCITRGDAHCEWRPVA